MSTINFLGIDFGGSKLKIATKNCKTPKIVLQKDNYTLETIPDILTSLKIPSISAVGVSCPGDIDYQKGVILKSLRLGKNIPLADIIRNCFNNISVFLLNDAQTATLAELHLGIGKKESSFLFVNLGTNTNSGVVMDGRLLVNKNGRLLGRIGHNCIDPNGSICRCGKRGCLDTYVSVKSILGLAKQKLGKEIDNAAILTELAEQGNTAAQSVWQEVAFILAIAISNQCNFLGVETAVVGGGISLAGEWLFRPLEKRVNELSHYPIKVLHAGIEHRLASVYGATILAEIGGDLF